MNKQKYFDVINEHVKLKISNVNAKLSDLEINSILFLKIIVTFETKYDIEFDEVYLNYNHYSTINDLITYVEKKVNEKQTSR